MTTPTELAASCYWHTMRTLRAKRLSPADWAMAMDTLQQLATQGTTRVRAIAANRLQPVVLRDDGAFTFEGGDCA